MRPEAQRAELRIWSGLEAHARLTLLGSQGSMTLEFDNLHAQSARLIRRITHQAEEILDLGPWDAHDAIFSVLETSRAVRSGIDFPSPSLHDATRAMEVTEATVRSLRRGRTVDLHYEPISEEATFKSVMTSTGCMILVGALFAVLMALAGPPLGFNWTIYIAYLIPPILVIFVMMQTLRFAVRRPDGQTTMPREARHSTRYTQGMDNFILTSPISRSVDNVCESEMHKLPAMVCRRTVKEPARPHSQPWPEPYVIDIVQRQPRWKCPAPTGVRLTCESVTLIHHCVETEAVGGGVKVAHDHVKRTTRDRGRAAEIGNRHQER